MTYALTETVYKNFTIKQRPFMLCKQKYYVCIYSAPYNNIRRELGYLQIVYRYVGYQGMLCKALKVMGSTVIYLCKVC